MSNPIQLMNGFRQVLHPKASAKVDAQTEDDKLLKACDDFEALFVKYMMQQMRETIPENGLFGQSQAEKIYTGMLDDEVAKSVS
ncbi:MAG: rod-binding protein, partial [Desulfobacteraceae bacterium]